jgi:predicted Zn-ribbon and HTH transcriptional regulator
MPRWRQSSRTIADDRGQAVPLWSPAAGIDDDPVQRGIAARVTQITGNENIRIGAVVGALAVLCGVFLVAVLGMNQWAWWLTLAVGLILAMLWQSRTVQQRVAPSIRLTLLSEARCASCAYDLRGLQIEDDGCTLCPECQAAWRISPDMAECLQARQRLAPSTSIPPGETASDRASKDWLRGLLTGLGWKRTYAARDARGRIVELVNPSYFAERPPRWEEVPAERRRSLRLRLSCLGWHLRLLALLVFGPAAASMLLGIGLLGPQGIMNSGLSKIPQLLAVIWIPVFFLAVVFHPITNSGRWLIGLMLREGHCPSCAGRLPAPGGDTITCPACRSEWQVRPDIEQRRLRSSPPPADDNWFRSIKPNSH